MDNEQHARDTVLMWRALDLAAQGPVADPNPRVGALVLEPFGAVVGAGFHAGAGTPHAEVVALRQAGAAARGGTAIVTLEPCNHTGLTPPCSRALIEAGVARVVFAQSDPNPSASGGGARLSSVGIEVVGGMLAAEAEALNDAWTFSFVHKRPKVTWKFAATFDGRAAAADGTSRWITGPEAQADVHDLRSCCDAILVGTGTILADDPQLTVRHRDGSARVRQPLRVVMGRRRIPESARVLDLAAPTLHLPTREPAEALEALAAQEIHHVWLEGGPTVAAAFLRAGLVDDIVAYLAPALLGGGPVTVGDLGIQTIEDALRLSPHEVTTVGPDIRVRATVPHVTTRHTEGR